MTLFRRPASPPPTPTGPLDPFWQYVLDDPEDGATLETRETAAIGLNGMLGKIMQSSSSESDERPFASRFFRNDDDTCTDDDDDDDTAESSVTWGYPPNQSSSVASTTVTSVGTATLASTKKRVPLEGFWGFMLGESDGEENDEESDGEPSAQSSVDDCTVDESTIADDGTADDSVEDTFKAEIAAAALTKPNDTVTNAVISSNSKKYNTDDENDINQGVEAYYQPGIPPQRRSSWLRRVSCVACSKEKPHHTDDAVETSWTGMMTTPIQPRATTKRLPSRLFAPKAKPPAENSTSVVWPIELDMEALAISSGQQTAKDTTETIKTSNRPSLGDLAKTSSKKSMIENNKKLSKQPVPATGSKDWGFEIDMDALKPSNSADCSSKGTTETARTVSRNNSTRISLLPWMAVKSRMGKDPADKKLRGATEIQKDRGMVVSDSRKKSCEEARRAKDCEGKKPETTDDTQSNGSRFKTKAKETSGDTNDLGRGSDANKSKDNIEKESSSTSFLTEKDRSQSSQKTPDAAAEERWVWELDRDAFRVPSFGGMFSNKKVDNEETETIQRKRPRVKAPNFGASKDKTIDKNQNRDHGNAASPINPLFALAGTAAASAAVSASSSRPSKAAPNEHAPEQNPSGLFRRSSSQHQKARQSSGEGYNGIRSNASSFFTTGAAASSAGAVDGTQNSLKTEKAMKRSFTESMPAVTESANQTSKTDGDEGAPRWRLSGDRRSRDKSSNKGDKNTGSVFNPFPILAGVSATSAGVAASSKLRSNRSVPTSVSDVGPQKKSLKAEKAKKSTKQNLLKSSSDQASTMVGEDVPNRSTFRRDRRSYDKDNETDDTISSSAFNPFSLIAGSAAASAAVSVSTKQRSKAQIDKDTPKQTSGGRFRRRSSLNKKAAETTDTSDDPKRFYPSFLATGLTAYSANGDGGGKESSKIERTEKATNGGALDSTSTAASNQSTEMEVEEKNSAWSRSVDRWSAGSSRSQTTNETSDHSERFYPSYIAAGAATAAVTVASKSMKAEKSTKRTSKKSKHRSFSKRLHADGAKTEDYKVEKPTKEEIERLRAAESSASSRTSDHAGFINPIASFFDEFFEATDSEDEGCVSMDKVDPHDSQAEQDTSSERGRVEHDKHKKKALILKKLRRERASKHETASVVAVKSVAGSAPNVPARPIPVLDDHSDDGNEWMEAAPASPERRVERRSATLSESAQRKMSRSTLLTVRPIPDTLGQPRSKHSVAKHQGKKKGDEIDSAQVYAVPPPDVAPTFRQFTAADKPQFVSSLQNSDSASTRPSPQQRNVRIKDDLTTMRQSYLETGTKKSLDSSLTSDSGSDMMILPRSSNNDAFVLPDDAFDSYTDDDDSDDWRANHTKGSPVSSAKKQNDLSQKKQTGPPPQKDEQREPLVTSEDRLGGIHIRTTMVESRTPEELRPCDTNEESLVSEEPPPSAYRTIML